MNEKLVSIEPEAREHYHTSTDLVPVAHVCPECGGRLTRAAHWQDALFRHGGYGGTRRVDTWWCCCGFERIAAVATERPPR